MEMVPEEKEAEALPAIRDIFAVSLKDGVLLPGRSRLTMWVFRNLWMIPASLILLALIAASGIYANINNMEKVQTLFSWDWIYPRADYMWCYDQNGDVVTENIYNDGIRDCTYRTSFASIEIAEFDKFVALTFRSWVVYLAIFLSLLLVMLVYTRFVYKVPETLLALAVSGRLVPPTDQNKTYPRPGRWEIHPQGWKTYPEDLKTALNSPWRYILFIIILVFAYAFVLIAGQDWLFTLNNFWVRLWDITLYVLTPLLTAYAAAFGVWVVIVVGTFIRWLTPIYSLDIQPSHGDGCGGLKRLGSLCFDMAIMPTIPAVVFGIGMLIGALRTPLSIFVAIAAMVMAILLAVLTFFVPVLDIHREMVISETRYFDLTVSRITPLEESLGTLLAAQDDQTSEEEIKKEAEIKKLEARLEKLKKLYPADFKYPLWPFTTQVLLTFYSAQVVPVITIVTGIIEFKNLFPASP